MPRRRPYSAPPVAVPYGDRRLARFTQEAYLDERLLLVGEEDFATKLLVPDTRRRDMYLGSVTGEWPENVDQPPAFDYEPYLGGSPTIAIPPFSGQTIAASGLLAPDGSNTAVRFEIGGGSLLFDPGPNGRRVVWARAPSGSAAFRWWQGSGASPLFSPTTEWQQFSTRWLSYRPWELYADSAPISIELWGAATRDFGPTMPNVSDYFRGTPDVLTQFAGYGYEYTVGAARPDPAGGNQAREVTWTQGWGVIEIPISPGVDAGWSIALRTQSGTVTLNIVEYGVTRSFTVDSTWRRYYGSTNDLGEGKVILRTSSGTGTLVEMFGLAQHAA